MLRLSILGPLLAVVLMSWLHYSDTEIGEIARLKQFDLIMQTDEPVKSDDIAILAIDEEAMEKYGQWPWSREVIANLVWDLREAGAYEIIIPIIMTEEDRLGGDMALAEAMVGAQGVIIAQVGSVQLDESKNPVPRGIAKIGDPLPWLYTWKGMLGPIPLLGMNAAGVGVLNTVPEIDGVVRRLPLFMAIGDDVYPSMAIEVMRVEKGIPSAAVKVNEGGIIAVRVKGFPIIKPDANAQIWLRWNKTFDSVSAASTDLSSLAGKKVIIGSSTSRIGGIIATPNGPAFNWMPMATSLQTLLDGDVIQRPWWATTAELLTTILIGLLIVVITRFAPYWIIGSMFVVGAGGLVYGSYYAWTTYLYLIDITMAMSTLFLVGLGSTFARFIVEFKAKQQIKKQFEHYLDPRQVKALQKNPELLKLGGERKEMSFLFMDIIGFTPISEFYKNKDDPEGLVVLVNEFLDEMTNIILANGGMVDKFMGDCIMAVYGAPIDMPNHAEMAVKSAIEIEAKTLELKQLYKDRGLPDINVGTGVNTGTAIIGNMGSTTRFDFSVIGDAVNLAARLEATAGRGDYLKYPTIYSSMTMEQLPESMSSKKIGDITVKGKKDVIAIYHAVI
jgi:adenylate cyclase